MRFALSSFAYLFRDTRTTSNHQGRTTELVGSPTTLDPVRVMIRGANLSGATVSSDLKVGRAFR